MTGRPTRTTNRLHFTDLEPNRFEDLCLALVYLLHPWVKIQHYGRLGDDGGVDIFAQERVVDESVRTWYVQCRRYKKATKATLKKAVDDALAKAPAVPNVLLVILACDVRREADEEYEKYALGKGVATPMLWTASLLETRLYTERKDLLFSYFGISATQRGGDPLLPRVMEAAGRLAESLSLGKLRGLSEDEARGLLKELFDLRGRLRKHSALIHALRDFEIVAGWLLDSRGNFGSAAERNETLQQLEQGFKEVIRQAEAVQ